MFFAEPAPAPTPTTRGKTFFREPPVQEAETLFLCVISFKNSKPDKGHLCPYFFFEESASLFHLVRGDLICLPGYSCLEHKAGRCIINFFLLSSYSMFLPCLSGRLLSGARNKSLLSPTAARTPQPPTATSTPAHVVQNGKKSRNKSVLPVECLHWKRPHWV